MLPIGPFFPVLEEPSYWRLFVEGETIVGCDYRGFYNHRGIEKLGDSVAHLQRDPVPRRAHLRDLRLHPLDLLLPGGGEGGRHRGAAPRRATSAPSCSSSSASTPTCCGSGIAGHILGFDTVLMQTWRIREPVMWLCEEISGNRKTYGMNTVGGVRRDLPPPLVPEDPRRAGRGRARADRGARRDRRRHDAARPDPRRRRADATTWARAGRAWSARRRAPRASPSTPVSTTPTPPTTRSCRGSARTSGGDTWARVLVRLDELSSRSGWCARRWPRMPDGPVLAEVERRDPGRTARASRWSRRRAARRSTTCSPAATTGPTAGGCARRPTRTCRRCRR